MHPLRKRRLGMILFLLLCVSAATGIALYALRQNINLYYIPSQITPALADKHPTIRVGGWVEKKSVHREAHTANIKFKVTDGKANITVHYTGVLPDLFREGQGIVVQGELKTPHDLNASEVLAKHDEKYTPPLTAPPSYDS